MKITNAIVWDHRGRVPEGQAGQLEIRITYNRKSYYIGTGIKVRRSEFVAGKIVNCMAAEELTNRLQIIYAKTMALINEYISESREIDVVDIRRRVFRVVENSSGSAVFLEWCAAQVPRLKVKAGTRNHYDTLITRLREWNEMQRWQDVTVENIMAFDYWLHQLKNDAKEPISDAAVYNYHKCLKALINRAVLFDKLAQNPYTKLRGKLARGEKENIEYLTEEEMQRFEDLQLPAGTPLDKAHDLFVIQMYTGLSFSDAMAFDISNYKRDGDRWIYTGERIKTGVPYVSYLLPPVVRVLEKNGYKVPQMDNADYNRHLKALGLMAGISTSVHSHLARHTFATFMLRNGVAIENVSKMLGHTNITQTQRYAKVLAQSVHDDFERIAQKLKKG